MVEATPKSNRKSKTLPLGATVYKNGINFSIYSPFATQVELLLFESENDTKPTLIPLDNQNHKTHYYWHIFIEGLAENQIYAYRIDGELNLKNKFDSSKILIDPYAKKIVGTLNRAKASETHISNLSECLKSVAISTTNFKWECTNPSFHASENILYEIHPSGFTQSLDTENSSGFLALIEKIPYLKKLGINTVELLPIFYFDIQDAFAQNKNYWGYSPINYFAVHPKYGSILDLKKLVQALHQNNIKIVLDVVYNHTAENDENGPTYSYKGICNQSYYLLDENNAYQNFSGCGNTLNTNHSVVRRMIIDSLLYWKNEFHIDGFRFDLASVFSRNEAGIPIKNPPIIWDIDSEPQLAETLLIAEPWDAQGLHQPNNFPGEKWSIWKDDFRDGVRNLVKGERGKITAFIDYFCGFSAQKPYQNVHFITSHDGFTLNDLVSYNHKHNLANGENNRDGSSHNLSYNHGVEGLTNDNSILNERDLSMKNFMFCLFFTHATPMLVMGDEVKRTQNGNNNAYCQDNKISWFDWSLIDKNADFLDFTKQLIQIRKQFKIFSYPDAFIKVEHSDKPYVKLHGIELNSPDLSHHSRSLALEYVYKKRNERLFFVFNFYSETLSFTLPEGNWKLLISTTQILKNSETQCIAKARGLYLFSSI